MKNNTKIRVEITFRSDIAPGINPVNDHSDLPGIKRPKSHRQRIAGMYACSNLIVTAWCKDKLVGISRSVTDFCHCCYLSDFVIREQHRQKEIGARMIEIIKEIVTKELSGEQSMLLLSAAPFTLEYFQATGLERLSNGFIINRSK